MAMNPADPHNAFLRQVTSYWEMAAAMVLHGAVSAELFVDCNAEGFCCWPSSRTSWTPSASGCPTFMRKTSEMVNRFTAAAARYEAALKNRRRDARPDATGVRMHREYAYLAEGLERPVAIRSGHR